MIDLERTIAAYATFLDEQSLARSSDHIILSEPDEGEVIMVDIKIRETGTDDTANEAPRRRWLPYTILAAAAAILVVVAIALFDGTEQSTPVDVVDNVDPPGPTEEVTTEVDVFGAESASAAVDAYFDAFEAGDIDSLVALSTLGTNPATTLCFPDTCPVADGFSLEYLEKLLTFKSAAGTVFIDPSCEPTTTSEIEVSVVCEYVEHPGVAQAIDGPTVPIFATFVVSPDGIESINRQAGAQYVVDIPFDRWMIQNHLDDRDGAVCCGWDSVEDARRGGRRAAQYAPEWAAFLEENDCDFLDLLCGRTG